MHCSLCTSQSSHTLNSSLFSMHCSLCSILTCSPAHSACIATSAAYLLAVRLLQHALLQSCQHFVSFCRRVTLSVSTTCAFLLLLSCICSLFASIHYILPIQRAFFILQQPFSYSSSSGVHFSIYTSNCRIFSCQSFIVHVYYSLG